MGNNQIIPSDEKGSALLFVLVIGVAIYLASIVTTRSAQNTNDVVKRRLHDLTAFNIAEAGIAHQAARLREGYDTLVNNRFGTASKYLSDINFNNGLYSVSCSSVTTKDTAFLHSTGEYKDLSSVVKVVCSVQRYRAQPNSWVNGAVVARSNIDLSGTMTVDGRDHDILGVLTGAAGVVGIQSCSTVTFNSGAQTVGGIGFAPLNPPIPGTYTEDANKVGYPTTPEQILSLPAGMLDVYRSADNAPTKFSDTVIYTTTNQSVPKMDGTGIFICHNDAMDAELRITGNVTIRGIVIVDKINRINGTVDVIGALITLSREPGSNLFGNGTANILYSTAALDTLKSINLLTKKRIVDYISWRQGK